MTVAAGVLFDWRALGRSTSCSDHGLTSRLAYSSIAAWYSSSRRWPKETMVMRIAGRPWQSIDRTVEAEAFFVDVARKQTLSCFGMGVTKIGRGGRPDLKKPAETNGSSAEKRVIERASDPKETSTVSRIEAQL